MSLAVAVRSCTLVLALPGLVVAAEGPRRPADTARQVAVPDHGAVAAFAATHTSPSAKHPAGMPTIPGVASARK